MQSVREIATDILRREGGYVNDPDDPGGATNFGVTIHTMRRLGLDLNNDGHVTTDDVKALSRDMAINIFIDHYFNGPRIGALPVVFHASVFDMYVNAGPHAVRILQRLFNEMRIDVGVDGVIGPQTIAAAERACAMAPEHIVDAYGIARRNYYYELADRRVASRKFARRRDGGKGGWIRRAEEFLSAKYHLTAEQHEARVAAWG